MRKFSEEFTGVAAPQPETILTVQVNFVGAGLMRNLLFAEIPKSKSMNEAYEDGLLNFFAIRDSHLVFAAEAASELLLQLNKIGSNFGFGAIEFREDDLSLRLALPYKFWDDLKGAALDNRGVAGATIDDRFNYHSLPFFDGKVFYHTCGPCLDFDTAINNSAEVLIGSRNRNIAAMICDVNQMNTKEINFMEMLCEAERAITMDRNAKHRLGLS